MKGKIVTISELREQGYKVKITHLRPFKKEGWLTKSQANTLGLNWSTKTHRGGRTVVSLLAPDGTETVGTAQCSGHREAGTFFDEKTFTYKEVRGGDTFEKSRGIQIALARAVKTLNSK